MCCTGQCPYEVNDYVNGGTKCLKPKFRTCPGEESDQAGRLDDLEKKESAYADDVNILLELQGDILEKIGESISVSEREILRLRLISAQQAMLILEPLTPDEIAERDEIMGDLRNG